MSPPNDGKFEPTHIYINGPGQPATDAPQGGYGKAGEVGMAVAQAGASMIPGVGEAMDVYTLFAADSTLADRGLSVVSLGANVLTGGLLPNFGGWLKAGRKVANVADEVGDVAKSAGKISDVAKAGDEVAEGTEAIVKSDGVKVAQEPPSKGGGGEGGGNGGGNGGGGDKKGPRPDQEPKNLKEEKLLEEARAGETAGTNERMAPVKNDAVAERIGVPKENLEKMRGPQSINDMGTNKEVHYVRDRTTGQTYEWKIKEQIPKMTQHVSPTGQSPAK